MGRKVESWKALGLVILTVASLGVGIGVWRGARGDGERPTATARYTILQFAEDGSGPVARIEGLGDFENGKLHHTMYLPSGEPLLERMELGHVAYTRYVGRDDSRYAGALGAGAWRRSDSGSHEGQAAQAVRNAVVNPSGSLRYFRSVADDVVEIGREKVRSRQTVHYRGTVELARAGGPTRSFPVEIWVDGDGLVRRYQYNPLGSQETFVWEFYDFGIGVNLSPPVPDAAP